MDHFLTPEEVQAIVDLYKGGLGVSSGPMVIDYDLIGGDQLLRRVAPVMDNVRPELESSMSKALTYNLGIPTQTKVLPNDIITFAVIAAGFPRPACVGVIELDGGGKALLDISPQLYYMSIERTLGGQGFDALPKRSATGIEHNIGKHFMEKILEAINLVWKTVLKSTFTLKSIEYWPEKLDVIEPEDMVLRQEISVKVGEIDTSLAIILPGPTIEPLRKKLDKTIESDADYSDKHVKQMVRQLQEANIDIQVELGKAKLQLANIKKLNVGDIIRLDTSTGDSLPVKVSGKTKFKGTPMVVRGNMAIKITDEPVN